MNEPFMPTIEISDEMEIKTTMGVIRRYGDQIAERDLKIADLILEREALVAKLATLSQD